jgi:hypothetical protein
MSIVFFCRSCGARFDVDPRMAGKKGRCKKCGQFTTVPHAQEITSMAAMPALAAAAVRGSPVPAGAAPAPAAVPGGSWLQGSLSNVALAPITIDRMRVPWKKPAKRSPLDDSSDGKPYELAKPTYREPKGGGSGPAGFVARAWRQNLGGIQKLFRKINQAAYLISVPFLMILIGGIVVGNRPIALFGATMVVLLNIARLAAGIANISVIPLREGFDLGKMKKPAWRVIEPAVTILLVVLAFTFIPWLSSTESAKGSISDRLRSSAQALKTEMKGEVGKYVDVEKLGTQAQATLKDLGDKAKDFDIQKLGEQPQQKLEGLKSPPNSSAPRKRIGSRIESVRDALDKRPTEEQEKAKALEDAQEPP